LFLSSFVSFFLSIFLSLLIFSLFHKYISELEYTLLKYFYKACIQSDQQLVLSWLMQRDQTSGPRATSGPRPLVTRPDKLFVNFSQLLQAQFFLFSVGFKKNRDSYLV
jgi:hypothetical protein